MYRKQALLNTPAKLRQLYRRWIGFAAAIGLVMLPIAGCSSPEDGRPRGGGPGADGGNYRGKPIHAPSKIDGTKPLPNPFPLALDAP
jgi:hypothetical protein